MAGVRGRVGSVCKWPSCIKKEGLVEEVKGIHGDVYRGILDSRTYVGAVHKLQRVAFDVKINRLHGEVD